MIIEIRKTDTFVKWLDGLRDIHARARILVRIERLALGNPGFDTILKVMGALGLKIHAEAMLSTSKGV